MYKRQANKRLPRPGQKHKVRIYAIIATDTYDEKAISVLDSKGINQNRITESVLLHLAET